MTNTPLRGCLKTYAPGQSFLLPPSPLDWLPEDHLARFILDVVQMLDLKAITRSYEKEHRGFPPHNPVMMSRSARRALRPRRSSS
jgi:hypothetical protein